jgi:hypothetical protein
VSSNGPGVVPDSPIPQAATPVGPGVGREKTEIGLSRARTLAMVGGLVAGLAAFGIGEATSDLIPAEPEQINFMGTMQWSVTKQSPRVLSRVAAVGFGVLGACLGGSLGIAGGLARRPVSAAAPAAGGLLGAVLGAALGAGTSLALVPPLLDLYFGHKDMEILTGMFSHSVIWGPLGAAAGLAFAVGLGERRLIGRALVAGLAGALLGTVVFDFVGALAFPLAKTDALFSETWPTRLLARLIISLGTAAALALSLSPAPNDLVALPAEKEADEGLPQRGKP